MRISTQQIQMQMKDLKSNKEMPLKLGDVFKGKVIAIQTEAILLQVGGGSSLRAAVEAPERFVEGQLLEFLVTEEPEGDLVKVAIHSEEIENKVAYNQIKHALETVDLKVSPENIKAYEMLKSYQIPITKDHIQNLSQNYKMLSKLVDHTGSEKDIENLSKTLDMPKDILLEKPIKDLVIKLLSLPKVEGQAKPTIPAETGLKENIKSQTTIQPELAQKNTTTDQDLSRSENMKEGKSLVSDQMNQEKDVLGLLKDSDGKLNLENTFEKLGMMVKLEKPITMQSLKFADRIMMGEDIIGQQVKTLMEEPEIKKNVELMALLKGFDFKNEKEDLKAFFTELVRNLEEAKPFVSSRVEKTISDLNDQINFLSKEQDDVSWLQVPVQVRERTETLEMFVKQEKKKTKGSGQKQTKVLIALNTHNLGLVQALINIKDKGLQIDFSFDQEDILSVFSRAFNALQVQLSEEFENVQIDGKVRGKITFREFVEEDHTHHINVRV